MVRLTDRMVDVGNIFKINFNSAMVRLTVAEACIKANDIADFNSAMVRLTGASTCEVIVREGYFNSAMVRLTVGCENGHLDGLLLFQFRNGSINSL